MIRLIHPRLHAAHLARVDIPSRSTSALQQASEGFGLGFPGDEPEVPQRIILVFDNSPSITASQGGNDPIGNRFYEAATVLGHLAAHSPRRSSTEVQVAYFDRSHYAVSPGLLRSKQHQQRIQVGLQVPPDAIGSSELRPVLETIQRTTDPTQEPFVWPVLVIFSDFLLTDANPDAVIQELGEFIGEVHAVCLGHPPTPELVKSVDATYYVGTEAKPGAVARSLFAALTANRPNAAPVGVSDLVSGGR